MVKWSPKILCDLPKVRMHSLGVSLPRVEQHLCVGLWGLFSRGYDEVHRQWENSYNKQACDITAGGNATPTPFHVLHEIHETNDSILRSLNPTADFPNGILTLWCPGVDRQWKE